MLRKALNSRWPSKPTSRSRELRSTPVIGPEKLLFIGGLHRSGTSILHRQLREHTEVSGFLNTGAPEDEGQLLQTVFSAAKDYGGPGRFAFDPRARLCEHDAWALSREECALLLRQWGYHWDLSRQCLIEKSPPNLIRGRFLQGLFPGCRMVFIVRHPVPVSLATLKWAGSTVAELLYHWASAHSWFLEDLQHLRNAMVLRYEDYTQDPSRWLRRVQRFAGLQPFKSEQATADRNPRYLSQWRQHREQLAPISRLLEQPGGILDQFGYHLDEPYVRAPSRSSPLAPHIASLEERA